VTVVVASFVAVVGGASVASASTVPSRAVASLDGFTPVSPAFYICDTSPVEAARAAAVRDPGIVCASVQYFEKHASLTSRGQTSHATYTIKTEQIGSGPRKVISCALGIAFVGIVAVLSEGMSALYTVEEGTYDLGCPASVVKSYITGWVK
jgi:hypothetical protein